MDATLLHGEKKNGKPKVVAVDDQGAIRVAPPFLLRPIDLTAYWAANPSATELDLTVDPADGTTELGPASGIYSSGGGAVNLEMVGSSTSSVFTLAAGGARSVGITKIVKASTTAATVEVSWG